MKPQFLIAAPSSGTGKTTVTQGLLRILSNRGLQVQPYKCGPDYLDTRHHSWAAGRPSLNLDTFMSSSNHVKQIYSHYLQNADAGVVEGVMGLFDGAKKMEGSSAQIAELLNIPIILVVNAKATAYSIAPLLYGFKNFYSGIQLKGVIFNFVSGESHYQFLKEACEDVGLTPLGYIPRNEDLHLPSRHLGLRISSEHDYETSIQAIADHINKTVDVDLLLKITTREAPYLTLEKSSPKQGIRIAVARDKAFNFTYHENLRALNSLGTIEYFSPLHDQNLPEADLVYLAGGYPELHLKELASNYSMQQSIKKYCEEEGKLLAECGGMMYLCNHIIDSKGKKFSMVGLLNQDVSMEDMKLHLGYRKITMDRQEFRGHEFHYSHLTNCKEECNIAEVTTARDKKVETPVFRKKNTVASYIHFYWGEQNLLQTLFPADNS
jgi:cobyrinic acid a,c-diamide synthase